MSNQCHVLSIIVFFKKSKEICNSILYIFIALTIWEWFEVHFFFLERFNNFRRSTIQVSIVAFTKTSIRNDFILSSPCEFGRLVCTLQVRTEHYIEVLVFCLFL